TPRALWYVTDRTGSVIDLVNAEGVAVQRTKYDGFHAQVEWGADRVYDFSIDPPVLVWQGSGVHDRFKLNGREADPVTGLQYYRGRWYDPDTARWVSESPGGLAGGDVNLYRFAHNGPH